MFTTDGDSVAVTNSNVNEYIHYVADFKLNKQFSKQCAAFVMGFREVIAPRWLSIFDVNELSVLIAGDVVTVDVDDMEKHTIYSDYSPQDSTIRHFWKVMRDLSPEDLQLFLKFVTSCPRPPMLGFKHLNPPLRIGRSDPDTSRLPSSSTCFNMLKLPPYTSAHLLKEKLLLALRSGAGFSLS
jgi:ubiquitin-protein ligase E3 C